MCSFERATRGRGAEDGSFGGLSSDLTSSDCSSHGRVDGVSSVVHLSPMSSWWLGIAVDGALHFLYWFRREVGQGISRRDAVGQSYRHCAKAITQTAIICGIGLLVYSFSGFVPTRRFAWMMCALLTAALVGDLLLLPALLVGPFGKFFVSDTK